MAHKMNSDFDSSSKSLFFKISDTNSLCMPVDRFLGYTEGGLMNFYFGGTTGQETVITLAVTNALALPFMEKLMDEINYGKKSVIIPETFFDEVTDITTITLAK
tara:strand:+ start:17767 stop:18078 length:312 start_codon:yes stop_codon:yes gene_type:complete